MKRTVIPSASCPVCWGKGKWPAISDSYWHKYGGTRGCDYIKSCPFCCGTGEVKATRTAIAKATDPDRLNGSSSA